MLPTATKNRWAIWSISILFLICGTTPALAQLKLDVGESVRVLFLGDWYDGIVLGKEKAQYGIEFQFANSTKQELFDRPNVRKLCEADALDYARSWESANGKFKVDAAMKSFQDDKVILVKSDLSEIEVTVSNLSQKDIAYVDRFKKANEKAVKTGQVPAATPALPDAEDFEDGFGASAIEIGASTQPIQFGQTPVYLQAFQQNGAGLALSRKGQDLVAVIPVGGPDQLVLMTAREDNFHNRGQLFQSQAYWVSLKQRKVLSSVALTPEHYILDYEPRSRLLVTASIEDHFSKASSGLTVWSLEHGGTAAEPLVRWNSAIYSWPGSPFCKIVDDQTVLVKTDKNVYKAWNFREKRSVYSIRSDSFFDAPGLLTYDRKSLVQPEDGKVTVFDAATGGVRFCLPVSGRHCSAANVNPQGTKLAALTESHVYVWDLTSSSSEPKVHEAPLIGSPFRSRIEWVDDDLILAESTSERVLYRLSLELPVWSYRMDTRQYWMNSNPLVNQVVNGLFFYVVKPDHFSSSIAVGAVSLPGPQVQELTNNIDRESLNKMKPGSAVRITLGQLSDPANVEKWLAEKIEQIGWKLDSNSEIEVFAEMGVGQPQTVTYREMGIGRKETTVTFTPHYANLIIREGDVVIWQTGVSTGASPVVWGSNVQQQVTQQQQPQLEFFHKVSIPSKIIDPKYSHGFGVSQLGLRGIEVVSTSPPGRDADPALAEQKMEADQRKDQEERRKQGSGEGDSNNGQ